MAKRGRAPKGEYAGKTEVMSFRITPSTKAALKRAAAAGNRSLSQEAEHRLRRGLDDDATISSFWGDAETFAIMRLAAQVIQSLDEVSHAKVHWTADESEKSVGWMIVLIGNCVTTSPLDGRNLTTSKDRRHDANQ